MVRSNAPTLGHHQFPQAGRSKYDDSGVMAMRAVRLLFNGREDLLAQRACQGLMTRIPCHGPLEVGIPFQVA